MLASVGVVDYWTYLVATIGIIILPGPNSIFVLATAAQRGVRKGYQAALGVFVGDAILMSLSAFGVASLLKTIPVLFLIVKVAGALYLMYLGITMLVGAIKKHIRPPLEADMHITAKTVSSNPFRKAVLLSLSNPKAILFFVAFFIQFVDPSYSHPSLSFLILGVTVELCSFVYLTFLIFTGSALAAWFYKRPLLTTTATAGVGLLFVGFGIKLATASLD